MASDYERVLCVKNKVFVYRIPPRPSNRGYRAADWKLDAPDWTGRLRVVAKGNDLFIKLEDKEGELFASCPVKEYPGIAVEAVTDSSRYFVLRIQDDNGRSAFIGIGFEDRGDSFDLNVSLQDHFKWLKQEEDAKKTTKEFNSGPKLDLGFKEGQTITINIGNKKSDSASKSRPKAQGASGGGLGILPPPPGGGVKLPAPPSGATLQQPSLFDSTPKQTNVTNDNSSAASSNVDFLLDFSSDSTGSVNSANTQSQTVQQTQQTSSDPWGDFTGASSQSGTGGDGGWVQF